MNHYFRPQIIKLHSSLYESLERSLFKINWQITISLMLITNKKMSHKTSDMIRKRSMGWSSFKIYFLSFSLFDGQFFLFGKNYLIFDLTESNKESSSPV